MGGIIHEVLVLFGFFAIAMPFVANATASPRGLPVTDGRVALPLVGAELVIIGYALTPGVGWGRAGEHPAINALSTILWLGGMLLLALAGARWFRRKRQP